MSEKETLTQSGHLPVASPDLVAARAEGGRWGLLGLSPALADLVGVDPQAVPAAGFERLFGDTVPPLPDLAAEVLERDLPLGGIRVRFAPNTILEAEVRPGGLTGDFRARTVLFFFRPAPAAEAAEVHGMRGASPAMREVFRKIARYAPTDAPVVVTGETGTGKELVAHALHAAGSRGDGPWVAVNCSAISEELLESELFGHEKGAFTGAVRTHRGRFERADGGTLFLDEIGEMPLRTQAKLLRVLEEKRIERVGAEQEREIDVRVVCATNVPLERSVGEGRFRADLYHRLAVLRIHLPPLRDRPEDLPLLVDYFLDTFNRKYDRRIIRLTPEALALLRSYLWPGNIRELRNVLERVYVETGTEVIGARAFADWIRERREFLPGDWRPAAATGSRAAIAPPWPLPSQQRLIASPAGDLPEAELVGGRPGRGPRSTRPAELDADEIKNAYRVAGGNLTAAARLLGVHRATLYRYMERLGLDREDMEK